MPTPTDIADSPDPSDPVHSFDPFDPGDVDDLPTDWRERYRTRWWTDWSWRSGGQLR
jgi:hypothetical protein